MLKYLKVGIKALETKIILIKYTFIGIANLKYNT